MNTFSERMISVLDRIVVLSIMGVLVALVLAYGGDILKNRMHGFKIGNFRIAHVYKLQDFSFKCGNTALRVGQGHLITAFRGGEENYALLTGDIEADWPEYMQRWQPVPVKRFYSLKLSLNENDLQRMIDENQQGLKELLAFESDALRLKQWALKAGFTAGDDLSQDLCVPQLRFYYPLVPGSMDLVILEDENQHRLDWAIGVGPRNSVPVTSFVWRGLDIATFWLFYLSVWGGILAVCSGSLAILGRVISRTSFLIGQPGRFLDTPILNLVFIFLTVLTSSALLTILFLA